MSNNRGFTMILLASLLPMMLAALTALYAVIALIEDRSTVRNECRHALLDGLEAAAPTIQKLLDLNPRAKQLRTQHRSAEIELAEAIESGLPPAIAAATAHFEAIEALRAALDVTQRAILYEAQTSITEAQKKAERAVSHAPIGFLRNTVISYSPGRPAVHPDMSDVAPLYDRDDPYNLRQALVQKWQSRFSIFDRIGRREAFNGRLEDLCAATLVEKDGWHAVLAEDKF